MLLRSAVRCLTTSAAASVRARTGGSGGTAVRAMGKSVYAVVTGRRPGLYYDWKQCQEQVTCLGGVPGPWVLACNASSCRRRLRRPPTFWALYQWHCIPPKCAGKPDAHATP